MSHYNARVYMPANMTCCQNVSLTGLHVHANSYRSFKSRMQFLCFYIVTAWDNIITQLCFDGTYSQMRKQLHLGQFGDM